MDSSSETVEAIDTDTFDMETFDGEDTFDTDVVEIEAVYIACTLGEQIQDNKKPNEHGSNSISSIIAVSFFALF